MSFRTGEIVGAYQIVRRIGGGGAGEVFEAQHLITNRIEALKALSGRSPAAEQTRRFLREIQIQASLSHRHIASVHNAFWAGDDLIMVMELVEGEPLTSILERGRMQLVTALDYACQALSALEYAHAHGVIHRDITPGNILVTAGGVVKLTDFGLARLTADRRLTQTGAVVGSVYYMSPEHLRATPDPDARSDIYSMGAVLYEMATGAKPFEGDSSFAIMSAHVSETPRPPVSIAPDVPAALSDVILKALAKDPEQRFRSAEEFRLALQQTPAAASKKSPPPLVWLWSLGAAASLLVVFLLNRGSRESPPPIRAAAPAPVVTEQPVKPKAGFQKVRSLSLKAGVWAVALSSSGRWLAAGAEEGDIEIWNPITGEKHASLRGHKAGVSAVCFSGDEQWLASGSADRTAKLWDLRKNAERASFPAGAFVTAVALAGDGSRLAAGCSDRKIKLWNVQDGGRAGGFRERTEPVALAFNPQARELAVAGMDGVKLWSVNDAREIRALNRPGAGALMFASDGRWLALSATPQALKLWDAARSRELASIEQHGPVRALAISRNGRMLASAGGRIVSVWGL